MFSYVRLSLWVAAVVQVSFSNAQTPPGYTPASPNTLGVTFANDVSVDFPGCLLSATETAAAPRLSVTGCALHSKSAYMAFMIDIDVPLSQDENTTLLHWYEPDLEANSATGDLEKKSSCPEEGAPYGGPAPPSGTHRYVELLFSQPDNYTFPEEFEGVLDPTVPARLHFNISEFVEAADLAEPVAANYFTVSSDDEEEAATGSTELAGLKLQW